MSVTDETKAIAPEAATTPAEAEPTKSAADVPVEEKKEETKVSLSRRRRAIPRQTMCAVIVYCIIGTTHGSPSERQSR